jgi:hypothetical protein
VEAGFAQHLRRDAGTRTAANDRHIAAQLTGQASFAMGDAPAARQPPRGDLQIFTPTLALGRRRSNT